MTRRVLLADADAFYVSVARLVDPEGAGREPFLIVGGTPEGRGVVTSASYEARAFGVRSAMPTGQALRLCPQAKVVPVARNACVRKSKEILAVLRDYTPVVEPASIDEYYLDMTGTERLYGDEPLDETAHRIRNHVLDATGLSVSIGGGSTKVIAKMAAKHAKPRHGVAQVDARRTGVLIVHPGEEDEFLRSLDLAEIPMIGPKFQARLAAHGLETVTDVLPLSVEQLSAWFGDRTGNWLYHRVRGSDVATVTSGYKRKSLGHEETFWHDLETDEELDQQLVRLAVRVAGDLRLKDLSGRTVTVKIKDYDFTSRSASHTLARPISTDRLILRTARKLLKQLRAKRRVKARLLGVTLSHLTSRDTSQLDLFAGERSTADGVETGRDIALAKSVDDISTKFGRKGIVRGVQVRNRRQPSN